MQGPQTLWIEPRVSNMHFAAVPELAEVTVVPLRPRVTFNVEHAPPSFSHELYHMTVTVQSGEHDVRGGVLSIAVGGAGGAGDPSPAIAPAVLSALTGKDSVATAPSMSDTGVQPQSHAATAGGVLDSRNSSRSSSLVPGANAVSGAGVAAPPVGVHVYCLDGLAPSASALSAAAAVMLYSCSDLSRPADHPIIYQLPYNMTPLPHSGPSSSSHRQPVSSSAEAQEAVLVHHANRVCIQLPALLPSRSGVSFRLAVRFPEAGRRAVRVMQYQAHCICLY